MHAFRSVDGKVCTCGLCLALVRIGQTATDPTRSVFFQQRALEELRIFQGRLLDFAELDRANTTGTPSSGAPPPVKAETAAGAVLVTPLVGGVEAKVEPAQSSTGEAPEDKRSHSPKKEKKKRSRKTPSRSRRRRTKRQRSPTPSKTSSKIKDSPVSSHEVLEPKEEPPSDEESREPLAEVRAREHTEALSALGAVPKARSSDPTPILRERERSPLPRHPPSSTSALRPPEPSHPPDWYQGDRGHWEEPSSYRARGPPVSKGKKKRERQQAIREVGWDAYFNAPKSSPPARR